MMSSGTSGLILLARHHFRRRHNCIRCEVNFQHPVFDHYQVQLMFCISLLLKIYTNFSCVQEVVDIFLLPLMTMQVRPFV